MIHVFTCLGVYIAVDVNSGAVHVLDKAAYELLLFVGGDPVRLEAPCPADTKEMADAWDELRELKENGLLFSEPIITGGIRRQTVFKALCLHVSHDCNLRCSYCFADSGDFGGPRSLMSGETAQKAVEFLIDSAGNRKNLEIDFFGGEPLLAFDVVRDTVNYARSAAQKVGKSFRFTITTNGMGLNAENTAFINEEMSNVVLSLDGRPEVNDRHRKTVGGGGSYALVAPKLLMLSRARGEKEYFVRGTYTPDNLDFTEDVAWLAESVGELGAGFSHISVEPAVLPTGNASALREEHLPIIYAEYDKLAQWLLTHSHIDFFHFKINLSQGPCIHKRLRGCGAGFEYAAVTPEGDLYPCHQFVGKKEFLLGNVFKGIASRELVERFSGLTVETREACQTCWAKYYCGGGCSAANWSQNGSIENPYAIGCALERKRVECALALVVLRGSLTQSS